MLLLLETVSYIMSTVVQKGVTKRLVIALWGVSMSLFLYYFSVSMELQNGVMKFFNFVILLFGGGVTYHVFTELLSCPQNEKNLVLWKTILIDLYKVIFGFILSSISIFSGLKLEGEGGQALMILGLLLGMIWSSQYLISLNKPIKKLLNHVTK